MLTRKEIKELEILARQLNNTPLSMTEKAAEFAYQDMLNSKRLVLKSTIDDIEDAILDLEEIQKDASDHIRFICFRAVNKLEKAKRQIKDLV